MRPVIFLNRSKKLEFNPKKMKALAEGIELLASARTHFELSQDAIFTSVDVEKAG